MAVFLLLINVHGHTRVINENKNAEGNNLFSRAVYHRRYYFFHLRMKAVVRQRTQLLDLLYFFRYENFFFFITSLY